MRDVRSAISPKPFSTVPQSASGINPHLALFLLGLVSWGLLPFNTDGIYWDDWVLIDHPTEKVVKLLLENGSWYAALFHAAFLRLEHPIIAYRAACLAATIVISLSFYEILLRSSFLVRRDAFFAAALALVFPVNPARVALITVPQMFGFALFMIAWYLSLLHSERRPGWTRFVPTLLFFISFSITSLLLFYVFPIMHLSWRHIRQAPAADLRTICRQIVGWARSHADYLACPFIFFLVKTIWFQPRGLYLNYNAVSLDHLVNGAQATLGALDRSFVEPILASSPELYVVLLVAGGAAIAIVPGWMSSSSDDRSLRVGVALVAAGLVMLHVAVYPYYVVDKIPALVDWNSRHQVLVPLGAALLLLGLLKTISAGNRRAVTILCAYFIATFAWTDVRVLDRYRVDWMKQVAIIEALEELRPVRDGKGRAFFFVDETKDELNVHFRSYRFYELSGLLQRAFGDQTRFGTSALDCPDRLVFRQFRQAGVYNIDDYEGGDFAGVITIQRGPAPVPWMRDTIGKIGASFDPSPSDRTGEAALVELHFAPAGPTAIPPRCLP